MWHFCSEIMAPTGLVGLYQAKYASPHLLGRSERDQLKNLRASPLKGRPIRLQEEIPNHKSGFIAARIGLIFPVAGRWVSGTESECLSPDRDNVDIKTARDRCGLQLTTNEERTWLFWNC